MDINSDKSSDSSGDESPTKRLKLNSSDLTRFLSLEECSIEQVVNLLNNCVEPTIEHVKQAYESRKLFGYKSRSKWDCIIPHLLTNLSNDGVANIVNVMPNIVKKLIKDDCFTLERLLPKGLVLTVDNFNQAVDDGNSDGTPQIIFTLLNHLTPELINALNSTSPNLYDLHMDGQQGCNESPSDYEEFAKAGIKVNMNNIIAGFKIPFRAFLSLLNLADDKVKVQIKYDIPDAVSKLFESRKGQLYRYEPEEFNTILELFLTYGQKVTFDDLELSLSTPKFGSINSINMLLEKLDISEQEQIKVRYPYILVRAINIYFKEYYKDGKYYDKYYKEPIALINLVMDLLVKYKIDVNYSDDTDGFILHNLIELSLKKRNDRPSISRILDMVFAQSNLDIDKMATRNSTGRIRAIDYGIQLKQFNMVQKLIVAGANCDGLVMERIKGHPGSPNIFKLLYTLGYSVIDNEHCQLREWFENQGLRTLLELSVMAVRHKLTRTELNQFISELSDEDAVLPKIVLDYFQLAHLRLEPKVDESTPAS